MNNLVINNKEYTPSEIGTINTPMDKQRLQRRMGMGVIANTVKALRFASSSDKFTCLIYYGNPKHPFIENILNEAVYNGKDVYYRVDNMNYPYTPTEPQKTARDKYIEKQEYKRQAQTARLEQIEDRYNGARIPEERKLKMRRFIRYYELEMPQSEPEWVETVQQLAYYIRNEVPYAFDENQYYICEECGDLVRRGTEHCCYCELPEPRTKLDYLVNGGE